MKSRTAYLLALITLLVDQATKLWALAALPGRTVPLLGNVLSLQLVRNPGAAFSLGSGSTLILTIISVVVTLGVIWALRRCESRPWALALGVILGGAIGNLIDRLVREPGFGRGHVIDFINYGGWFIGNIADIALVLGVIVLIVLELTGTPFASSASDTASGTSAPGEETAEPGAENSCDGGHRLGDDAPSSSPPREPGADRVNPDRAGESS
ncbi:MAG: signal peptidase II [Flaviflexus sp.]|nr:signal peptidase II [Flaviflexus sp.]